MVCLLAVYVWFFFLRIWRPPRSTLFPYTTLFRPRPRHTHQRTRGWRCDMTLWPERSHSSSSPSRDRKSTRLNSSHTVISYAVFCLKKKKKQPQPYTPQHTTALQPSTAHATAYTLT